MKIHHMLLGAIALTTMTLVSAQAQTELRITGATAFRTAALNALLNRFQAGGSFRYAHNGTSFTGSTYAVFEGDYPGVPGTTTVRTSFNGSVEGVNALANSPSEDPSFLPSSVLTGSPSASGTVTASVSTAGIVPQQAHLSFSDVSKDSTPYGAVALEGGPVGVVVFTMLANEGAPVNLTNVTNKQFEALFTAGLEELSLFTGDAADDGELVFAVGRNDGSGTRTTYLAETGVGIVTQVQQFIATVDGVSGDIDELRLSGPGNQPSTIWGQNVLGNGGYSSGGTLRSVFGAPLGALVDIYFTDDTSSTTPDFSAPVAALVTFLSNGDAVTAIGLGAKALSFNGVGITPANPLGATDVDKVAYGAYTAWGYQQLYRISGLSTDQLTIDTDLRTNIPGLLGSAGIPISTMQVTRTVDGGVVTSL